MFFSCLLYRHSHNSNKSNNNPNSKQHFVDTEDSNLADDQLGAVIQNIIKCSAEGLEPSLYHVAPLHIQPEKVLLDEKELPSQIEDILAGIPSTMWKQRESNPSHRSCKDQSPPWNMCPHPVFFCL